MRIRRPPRPRVSKKTPEVDLAEKVIAWLESEGWDVYQEVDEIDIVAVRGSLVWVIECKTVMGFEVLEQGISHRASAHGSWIATPPRKRNRNFAESVCKSFGLGWIVVSNFGEVTTRVHPYFNRKARTAPLRKMLRPEHKTFAKAGSPTGKRWTPFKETCRNLSALVNLNPGVPMREAMKSIKHHYKNDSSAMRSLSELIQKGIVPGVRAEHDVNGVLVLRPRPELLT